MALTLPRSSSHVLMQGYSQRSHMVSLALSALSATLTLLLISLLLPPPPEEVNEVAIQVEREEDEGGTSGETFTDYRPPKLSVRPPHSDSVVETSSLSAMQPPEPTYDLKIKEKLEYSQALSCLQIETVVYTCQRHYQHLQTCTSDDTSISPTSVDEDISTTRINYQITFLKKNWVS